MKRGWHNKGPQRFGIKQVAEMFGVGTSTICRWVTAGTFMPPLKNHALGNGPMASKFWTAEDIAKEKAKRGMK